LFFSLHLQSAIATCENVFERTVQGSGDIAQQEGYMDLLGMTKITDSLTESHLEQNICMTTFFIIKITQVT
jgi:hypothetical protein